MKNKYYIPTFYDVIPDLEYEIFLKMEHFKSLRKEFEADFIANNELYDSEYFKTELSKENFHLNHDRWLKYIDSIRVKYLDREDIESFGINKSVTHYHQPASDTYFNAIIGGIKKGHLTYYLTYIPDQNKLQIQLYSKDNESTLMKDGLTPIQVFYGTVENKSELKKVLIQIGVIKDKISEKVFLGILRCP